MGSRLDDVAWDPAQPSRLAVAGRGGNTVTVLELAEVGEGRKRGRELAWGLMGEGQGGVLAWGLMGEGRDVVTEARGCWHEVTEARGSWHEVWW